MKWKLGLSFLSELRNFLDVLLDLNFRLILKLYKPFLKSSSSRIDEDFVCETDVNNLSRVLKLIAQVSCQSGLSTHSLKEEYQLICSYQVAA